MKVLKFGCFGLIGIFILIIAIGFIFGDDTKVPSSKSEKGENPVDVLINAKQFSRISSKELISIMGEPEDIDEFMWMIPTSGKEVPAKTYIYEGNKYDFMLIDDTVVRFNVYTDSMNDADEDKIKFNTEEDLFAIFDIVPGDNLKKVADTGHALRFSPVSDKVADFWILDIEEGKFGIAKITYDLNYF